MSSFIDHKWVAKRQHLYQTTTACHVHQYTGCTYIARWWSVCMHALRYIYGRSSWIKFTLLSWSEHSAFYPCIRPQQVSGQRWLAAAAVARDPMSVTLAAITFAKLEEKKLNPVTPQNHGRSWRQIYVSFITFQYYQFKIHTSEITKLTSLKISP